MKTLTREAKKLREEAIPSAGPGRNGDRFWLREFNAKQSIERYQCLDEQCQHFERRGTEFKVKCGLEFYRAKLNLKHGEWYIYLKKSQIKNPSTATRRMQTALDFMIWAKVIRPEGKVKEQHIIAAMEISYLKPCKLHGFAEYKHESFNENEFNAEMMEVEGKKERKPWLKPKLIINWRSIPGEDRELGFDPIELSQFIQKHLGDWSVERQAKIIEELRLTVDILRVLLHDLKVHYEPEIKKLISSLPKKRDAEIDALSKMLAFLQPDSYRQSNF